MKKLLLIAMLAGCHKVDIGGIGEACRSDGSCNSELLECLRWTGNGPYYTCQPKRPVTLRIEADCSGTEDCFCHRCNKSCATGVKICAYSDTSVWGAKPSTCECK